MNFPGQQQGGGQPGGAGFGRQSSPNQPTTTISATAHTSTSSSLNSPTSNSTSSGVHKGAIIGGIVGGLAGLLLISLLGVCLLKRRKKRQSGARTRKTQPVTYSSLNSVFRGVPFNRSNSQSPHDSLLPSHRSPKAPTRTCLVWCLEEVQRAMDNGIVEVRRTTCHPVMQRVR
jgi:hypothetical protein